jgi:glycerophosphoryl diester phosphodiesterase
MSDSPLLIAHGGSPESNRTSTNPLVSLDQALEHGCHGIRLDLRLTGCGRPLVCCKPQVNGINVARANSRQLLHYPCVDDVLRHYGRQVFLDIDVKVRGAETKVINAIRERAPHRNYVVSSSLPSVVMEIKARSAVIPTGIVCKKPSQLAGWRKLPVEYVMVHSSLLSRRLVHSIQDAGRRVFALAVNDAKGMLRIAGWGADAIVSDDPKLLVQTLG